MLAVAVGRAAGQGQRQGVFAGGQKPRQREFVRRPEGDARRLTVDSQLGHLLPGQGQQRRGGLQLRCCDLQGGAVGLGEMGRVLVRKGKGWCGQRQIGRRQGKGLAFPRSAGEQQQAAARGQLQRQAGPLGGALGRAGALLIWCVTVGVVRNISCAAFVKLSLSATLIKHSNCCVVIKISLIILNNLHN